MWLVIILCIIVIFLLVLALYRLHTIDKIKEEYDDKVKQVKNGLFSLQEENTKLRTFKYITEDLVTGMRTDAEVRKQIKELLFDRK